MKKRNLSIEKLNRIGFRSSVSIYKEKFSDKEITFKFKSKFSITKKIRFSNTNKIANNLSKHFKRLKPFKF
jgi:hypothetical protein